MFKLKNLFWWPVIKFRTKYGIKFGFLGNFSLYRFLKVPNLIELVDTSVDDF